MTLTPGMVPRWTVACIVVAAAVLLAGQQLAIADTVTTAADTPSSSAAPAATATTPPSTASVSSSTDPVSSTTMSISAAPTSAGPTSAAPTSVTPAAPTSSTSPSAAPSTSSGLNGLLTASFSQECINYGYSVDNLTSTAQTVTLDYQGPNLQPETQVFIVQSGWVHDHLDFNVAPADGTTIYLNHGALGTNIASECHSGDYYYSVTIKANSVYVVQDLVDDHLGVEPPYVAHGVLNFGNDEMTYTPDPCFSGVDHLAYSDPFDYSDPGDLYGYQITVTVLPGACNVLLRHSVDCATGSVVYTATNPYTLPAKISWSGSATGSASVPAGKTVMLLRSSTGGAGRLTFRLPDANRTLLADDVSSLCPQSQTAALASTGSPTGTIGLAAGLLLLAGLSLVVTGRRRRV
ncbi:MAG: hypothetical protein M3Y42_07565 [Actinomycetota bacterium]|nr:hypothetical protein [Actinomycetota bacterium]MDQ2956806.1 hypothetical protein [Actinomycetota bacterium]